MLLYPLAFVQTCPYGKIAEIVSLSLSTAGVLMPRSYLTGQRLDYDWYTAQQVALYWPQAPQKFAPPFCIPAYARGQAAVGGAEPWPRVHSGILRGVRAAAGL